MDAEISGRKDQDATILKRGEWHRSVLQTVVVSVFCNKLFKKIADEMGLPTIVSFIYMETIAQALGWGRGHFDGCVWLPKTFTLLQIRI